MSVKESADKGTLPPYVSYRTFRNFLERMGDGIPSRIDRSIMGSAMAGGTVTQLLTALRVLRLINESGRPESQLEELVTATGEERQQVLAQVLRNAYPSVFELDLRRASAQEFREKFRQFTTKDDVINKCQAFFRQAAEDAGIELSPYITERAKATGQPRRRRKLKQGEADVPSRHGQIQTARRTIEEMILQKYPEFNPEWSKEAQEAWMTGLMRLYAELKGEEEESDEVE